MNILRWLLIFWVLLLSGCVPDEFDDLKKFVNESGQGMRGVIPAPAKLKPYVPFTYTNPDHLPDPFMPRIRAPQGQPNKNIANAPPPHPHEELEDYPLDSLKMVGYVYIHHAANAVILSPDHKIHHVHVGNYMGENLGKIISISEDGVKLKEWVLDSTTGGGQVRYTTLQMEQK